MDMNQLHAPAALHPGRDPDDVGIGDWVGLEDLEKEKTLAPARIRTPDLSARSIIIITTTLSRLPSKTAYRPVGPVHEFSQSCRWKGVSSTRTQYRTHTYTCTTA